MRRVELTDYQKRWLQTLKPLVKNNRLYRFLTDDMRSKGLDPDNESDTKVYCKLFLKEEQ